MAFRHALFSLLPSHRHIVGGYGILPYPRHPLRGGQRSPLHQPSKRCTNITILPRNSPNSQNLLAEKSLPRISQMLTDFSSLPITSSFFVLCEDSLVAAWVWQGCHTLLWLALFCDEVEFMSCQYSIFLLRY